MHKVNNVIRLKASLKDSFFQGWCIFLKPFHNLTAKETQLLASLLKYRYELSKVIKDDNILDKVTLDKEIQEKVMADCNIKPSHFQVILGKFRKKGVIKDGKINPRFIPNIIEGRDSFQLLLLFDLE